MRTLKREKCFPFFVAMASGVCTLALSAGARCHVAGRLGEPMLTVMITLLGFLGAIIAVLSAFPDNQSIKWLKKAGKYPMLVGYARSAVYLAFYGGAASAAIVYFGPESTTAARASGRVGASNHATCVCAYLVPIWVGVCTWAWAAAFRFARLVFRAMEG